MRLPLDLNSPGLDNPLAHDSISGTTAFLTPGGALTNGPAVHKNIGYDPAKAFTPV